MIIYLFMIVLRIWEGSMKVLLLEALATEWQNEVSGIEQLCLSYASFIPAFQKSL